MIGQHASVKREIHSRTMQHFLITNKADVGSFCCLLLIYFHYEGKRHIWPITMLEKESLLSRTITLSTTL